MVLRDIWEFLNKPLFLPKIVKEDLALNSEAYEELEMQYDNLESEFIKLGKRENRVSGDQQKLLLNLIKLKDELSSERNKSSKLEKDLQEASPLIELGRHIQEESPYLIINIDENGFIRDLNPSAKSCISYKGEVIGKKPSQILKIDDETLKRDMFFWNYLLAFEKHAKELAQGDIPFPHNIFKIGDYTFRIDGYINSSETNMTSRFTGGSVILTPRIEAKSFFDKKWISWTNPFVIKGEVDSSNILGVVYHPIEQYGRDINYIDFRQAKVNTNALSTLAKLYKIFKA